MTSEIVTGEGLLGTAPDYRFDPPHNRVVWADLSQGLPRSGHPRFPRFTEEHHRSFHRRISCEDPLNRRSVAAVCMGFGGAAWSGRRASATRRGHVHGGWLPFGNEGARGAAMLSAKSRLILTRSGQHR
jgi:hypothetical protein